MKNLIFTIMLFVCMTFNAFAAQKCETSSSANKTVVGEYLGFFESEEGLNTVGLKTARGKVYFVASAQEAEDAFGTKVGIPVELTYRTDQFYVTATAECARLDVLVGGKKIASASEVKSADRNFLAEYMLEKKTNLTMRWCDGAGATPELICHDKNGNLTTVDMNKGVLKRGDSNKGVGYWAGYRESDEPFAWTNGGDKLSIITKEGITVFKLVGGQYLQSVEDPSTVYMLTDK